MAITHKAFHAGFILEFGNEGDFNAMRALYLKFGIFSSLFIQKYPHPF